MSDHQKNKPTSIDLTPSNATSPQDKINQKLLALRLKKEEVEDARIQRAQEKEKSKSNTPRKSIDTKRLSSIPPVKAGTWKVPFTEQPKPLEQADATINKTEDKSDAGSAKPAKGILTSSIKRSLKGDGLPKPNSDYNEEDKEIKSERPSVILLSKPGSRNIVKNSITFSPPQPIPEVKLQKSTVPPKSINAPLSDQPVTAPAASDDDVKQIEFGPSILSTFANPTNPVRHSERPIAISRAGEGQQQIEELLISNNTTAKHKINESLLHVLKSGKDEAMHITIIPADEAKVLQLELKQWRIHRIAFIILFVAAMLIGFGIVALTFYASIKFILLKAHNMSDVVHNAHNELIVHAELMIVGTVFLSAIGLLVFRLLPELKKRTVVQIHILIFTIICLFFGYGFGLSFHSHQRVTHRPEHLYTIHAMVGLIICIFLLFEIGTGIYVTFPAQSKGSAAKYHSALGMMTFMLSGACCVSGYLVRSMMFTEDVTRRGERQVLANITGVLIIVFCCLVRYIASDFRFRRRAQPEWDTVFARSWTSLDDLNIDRDYTLQQYVRTNALPPKKI